MAKKRKTTNLTRKKITKRTHKGKCGKRRPAVEEERVPAFKVSVAHVWRVKLRNIIVAKKEV